jgi:hypothetical protein
MSFSVRLFIYSVWFVALTIGIVIGNRLTRHEWPRPEAGIAVSPPALCEPSGDCVDCGGTGTVPKAAAALALARSVLGIA